MSTAAAAADAPAPAGKGKKKLIIIIAAVVLLAAVGGGAAFFLLKKKPVDAEEDVDGHADAAPAKVVRDPKHPPTFVPLDTFTVNLADTNADRYVQVGITLEIGDAKVGDQIKTFMPAIRNQVLMALAEKTATQLMSREGKEKFAREVQRETSRVLGADVPDEDEADAEAAHDEGARKPRAKPKARRKAHAPLPVQAVHFSNFIIQ